MVDKAFDSMGYGVEAGTLIGSACEAKIASSFAYSTRPSVMMVAQYAHDGVDTNNYIESYHSYLKVSQEHRSYLLSSQSSS
jgi:hypothetical protein